MQKILRPLLLLIVFVVGLSACHSNPYGEMITSTQYRYVLYNPVRNVVAGNPQGKITLVEFFDYNCIYCRHMVPVIERFISAHPDVRVVFKDLNKFQNKSSESAALAALAANRQGRYLSMSKALLLIKRDTITTQHINQIAQQLHLNLAKLHRDMRSPMLSEQIKRNDALAENLNIPGTPTFIFGVSKLANHHAVLTPHDHRQYVLIGAQTLRSLDKTYNKISHA